MAECLKCGRDVSYSHEHHVEPKPPEQASWERSDETVTLCTDCHRCITYTYNEVPGLSPEEHRDLLEVFCLTGMPPMWDYLALGAVFAARSSCDGMTPEQAVSAVTAVYEAVRDRDDTLAFLNPWPVLDERDAGDGRVQNALDELAEVEG